MIKLLIIPEGVYDQYEVAGVQFNKLLCPNYMVSVSSIADIADIDEANKKFPFDFGSDLPLELADSPSFQIETRVNEDNVDSLMLKDMHNRLKERLATTDLIPNTMVGEVTVYELRDIDENLWVVVQKSKYMKTDDPVQDCIRHNHEFFDSMIEELSNHIPFEQVATSNLFKQYLSSSR